MLSLEYPVDVAVFSRDVSGTGIFLARGEGIAHSGTAGFLQELLPLLRAQRVQLGGPVGAFPSDARKHNTTSKFTIMTRLAAANGGPSGSHPAREPV